MQTICGKFRLKLVGVPALLFVSVLELVSEKGSRARGWGLHIGPVFIGVVPQAVFKQQDSQSEKNR